VTASSRAALTGRPHRVEEHRPANRVVAQPTASGQAASASQPGRIQQVHASRARAASTLTQHVTPTMSGGCDGDDDTLAPGGGSDDPETPMLGKRWHPPVGGGVSLRVACPAKMSLPDRVLDSHEKHVLRGGCRPGVTPSLIDSGDNTTTLGQWAHHAIMAVTHFMCHGEPSLRLWGHSDPRPTAVASLGFEPQVKGAEEALALPLLPHEQACVCCLTKGERSAALAGRKADVTKVAAEGAAAAVG